ncbi:MAG: DUF3107 domain-containing protein [Candidatus Nanopelagicaceae bacterium]
MAHIRIAVINVNSELTFESSGTPKEVKAAIDKAIAAGSTLSLTDTKGREYLIPAEKIGYVEIGEPSERRVGFGK